MTAAEPTQTARHTPGPWRVMNTVPVNGEGLTVVLGADGYVVAHAFYSVAVGTRGTPEAEANAHLCAAAPDLLAACMALVDELYFESEEGKYVECKQCGADDTTPCEDDCLVKAARAAIAKAENGERL